MKPAHQKILDQLYQVEHDWQKYDRNYQDRMDAYEKGEKKNLAKAKAEDKEKIKENYRVKREAAAEEYNRKLEKFKINKHKMVSLAVQKTAEYKNALNHNTGTIRRIKKDLEEIDRIHALQKEAEQEHLTHVTESHAALKEIIASLEDFITNGAPKLSLAPKDLSIKGKPKVLPPKIVEEFPEEIIVHPKEIIDQKIVDEELSKDYKELPYFPTVDEDGNPMFECKLCGKQYEKEATMKGHHTLKHKVKKED